MRNVTKIELIPFPDTELKENFSFSCTASDGEFEFYFKYLNDRWNLWVKTPDEKTCPCGTYPNVINWSGHNKYGFIFKTSLSKIDYSSLFLTEFYLLTWQ